jgi:PST family polysaccharide transporter
MENSNNVNSYRNVFKATALFGGVQVYQILISIAKSKFIAVLLGPAGVGILGLYQNSLQLIQSITSMGLSSSAVRDVSDANGRDDQEKVGETLSVIRKLVWATGILGLTAVAAFSPFLSKFAFGNYDYTVPFLFLSVTLLLDQLCAGQKVALQGLRKLKYLAKATAVGSTLGLCFSVPLYYLMGIKGIVPTLVLTSLTNLALSWFFARKLNINTPAVTIKKAIIEGRGMLTMGISMSITNVLSYLVSYLLLGFLSREGGVEEVGLFNAGQAIILTYTGLVLNAMSTDYYPRLAAVSNDNNASKVIINQQAEIGVLILAPLLTICIIFMPVIVTLLYSDSFHGANIYIVFAASGMLLKLMSWSIAYVFIAKGESKLFVINETIINIVIMVVNICGYKVAGLMGMGIGFIICYFVYFIQVYVIARIKYGYRISNNCIKTLGVQSLLIIISLVIYLSLTSYLRYSFGSLVIIASALYSLYYLNKLLDLKSVIKKK